MTKNTFTKVSKYIAWKALGAFVFVAVAGTSLWALAAFTEPTAGPAASIQDFATNLLGANNSDNAFDSSDVAANPDGSVIERLENLERTVGKPTAISAVQSSANRYTAKKNCYNLSATADQALNGSDTGITYTDWRLPTVDELELFNSLLNSSEHLWTESFAYAYGAATVNYYYRYDFSTGTTTGQVDGHNTASQYRCVR